MRSSEGRGAGPPSTQRSVRRSRAAYDASVLGLRGEPGDPHEQEADHPTAADQVRRRVRPDADQVDIGTVREGEAAQAERQDHQRRPLGARGSGKRKQDERGQDEVTQRVGERESQRHRVPALGDHGAQRGDPGHREQRAANECSVKDVAATSDQLVILRPEPHDETHGGNKREAQEAEVGRRRERHLLAEDDLVVRPDSLARGPRTCSRGKPPPGSPARTGSTSRGHGAPDGTQHHCGELTAVTDQEDGEVAQAGDPEHADERGAEQRSAGDHQPRHASGLLPEGNQRDMRRVPCRGLGNLVASRRRTSWPIADVG